MSEEIDATGLLCPLPVLKLRKRMGPLEDGAMITLRADDPAIIAKWGGSAPHETFAALRAGKDNF